MDNFGKYKQYNHFIFDIVAFKL